MNFKHITSCLGSSLWLLFRFIFLILIPLYYFTRQFEFVGELLRPDYNWTWFLSVLLAGNGIKVLPGPPCLFVVWVNLLSLFGLPVS